LGAEIHVSTSDGGSRNWRILNKDFVLLTTRYQGNEITRMKLGWGLGSTWRGRELETGLEKNLKNEEWRGG
jgi:hypothetical protein